MDISVGTVIRGKYRIDRILGQGGMGVVVGAYHLALEQRVAIKFVLPSMLEHPALVERFAREARAASKIQSDHVARVLDVDSLDDGTPFMVMEYLEGDDLSSVRRSGVGLPVHVAVRYLIEACEAIGEAHQMGIIHRDLKPANLFLSKRKDGKTRVKVLDFGISKASSAEGQASMTQTSMVVGSAEYMSPEQMMSARDVDVRTDIWALGVTLYELLTAQVPFRGESITQVCALVLQTQPNPPSKTRPEVSDPLDRLILRCLAKDRVQRFSSVVELVQALTPFAHESPSASDGARNSVQPEPGARISPASASAAPAWSASQPAQPTTVLPSQSDPLGSGPHANHGSGGHPVQSVAGYQSAPPIRQSAPSMDGSFHPGQQGGSGLGHEQAIAASRQLPYSEGHQLPVHRSYPGAQLADQRASTPGTQAGFAATAGGASKKPSRAPLFVFAGIGLLALGVLGAAVATNRLRAGTMLSPNAMSSPNAAPSINATPLPTGVSTGETNAVPSHSVSAGAAPTPVSSNAPTITPGDPVPAVTAAASVKQPNNPAGASTARVGSSTSRPASAHPTTTAAPTSAPAEHPKHSID